MKTKIILTLLFVFCVSCSVTQKKHEEIEQQVRAYEEELKALISLEIAMKDYSKGQTSLEICEYRIDDYMYIRRQNKKQGLLIGIALPERPTEEEYRKSEKYLLDEIHLWKKSITIAKTKFYKLQSPSTPAVII